MYKTLADTACPKSEYQSTSEQPLKDIRINGQRHQLPRSKMLSTVDVVCDSIAQLGTDQSINFKLAQLARATHAIYRAGPDDPDQNDIDHSLVMCVARLINRVVDEALAADWVAVKSDMKYTLVRKSTFLFHTRFLSQAFC